MKGNARQCTMSPPWVSLLLWLIHRSWSLCFGNNLSTLSCSKVKSSKVCLDYPAITGTSCLEKKQDSFRTVSSSTNEIVRPLYCAGDSSIKTDFISLGKRSSSKYSTVDGTTRFLRNREYEWGLQIKKTWWNPACINFNLLWCMLCKEGCFMSRPEKAGYTH